MSKQRKAADNRQLSLFELVRLQASPSSSRPNEGSMRCVEELQGAMRAAIKSCQLSRYQIAGEMSHLLGKNITKEQIDSWTRETDSPDLPKRHIPAEYLPAFCRATGSMAPIEVMGRTAGMFVLPGPDALRAEMQKLDEQIRELQAERKRRAMFLKEMG